MQFLAWLEATSFSTWLRESTSPFAFPSVLTLHTISMAFLAGFSAVIDLRLLGFADRVPMGELKRFAPWLWAAFWVSVVTGVCLLVAYPTKAVTNPVFYVKLVLIAVALAVFRLIRMHALGGGRVGGPIPRNVRALAAISVAAWVLVIIAGRLLPYTYSHLLADGGPP